MKIIEISKFGYNHTYPNDEDQTVSVLQDLNKEIEGYNLQDIKILDFKHKITEDNQGSTRHEYTIIIAVDNRGD